MAVESRRGEARRESMDKAEATWRGCGHGERAVYRTGRQGQGYAHCTSHTAGHEDMG